MTLLYSVHCLLFILEEGMYGGIECFIQYSKELKDTVVETYKE